MMWVSIISFLTICGAAFAYPGNIEAKIVGGEETNIESVPYQVALYRYHDRISGCGGSIISEYAVITAAHCVVGLYVDEVTFSAGSAYNNRSGTIHRADWIVVHFDYDFTTLQNDIAFVKVVEPFVFSDQIKAAALPTAVPAPGTVAVVSGWGKSGIGGASLQSESIPTLSLETCQSRYSNFDLHPTADNICAAPTSGAVGPCDGDAGAPLAVNGTVVGIFVWTGDCGQSDFPSVFASVPYFRSFIDEYLSYIKPLN